MKDNFKKQKGFTIIETMIAVALFTIVVTIGMNSLLNASAVHKKSQDQRSLLDNLTFIMEDMSRNIRTGYNYHCMPVYNGSVDVVTSPKSCGKGAGIVFEAGDGNPADDTDQWVYIIKWVPATGQLGIFKDTKGCSSNCLTLVQLSPDEIIFDNISGFTVRGAEPASSLAPGNRQQPIVDIYLVGRIVTKGVTTKFSLQTSVSQRLVNRVP